MATTTNLEIPSLSPRRPFVRPVLASLPATEAGTGVSGKNTLNDHFLRLLGELCGCVSEFASFDPARIEVSLGASRSRSKNGIWAYVTPLRYVGGALCRQGRRRGIPGLYSYVLQGHDLTVSDSPLYLVTVLLPRFFFLNFEERLETLVHELYHFHPNFRGDLRRFARPHLHHGPTPAAFNRRVKELTAEALGKRPSLREHPLLTGSLDDFKKDKKRRLARPRLRFVPKLLGLAIPLLALLSATSRAADAIFDEPLSSSDAERTWRWPWEDRYVKKPRRPEGAMAEELDEFDTKSARELPRFIVSPKEVLTLRTSPSEWAANLIEIGPGQNFLAFTMDTSGEWVFLRSRKVQGWVEASKLQVVGQLARPKISEDTGTSSRLSVPNSGTRLDGDALHVPGAGTVRNEDLLNFNPEIDSAKVIKAGPLYEQPDPLSTRYGSLHAGDKILILKRGDKGDWLFVRLLLTGEEGWFPAEAITIERGERVSGAGSGRIVIDVDGAYGNAGRNYGFGGGLYVNLWGGDNRSRAAPRFEVGGFYQAFAGENLSYSASQGSGALYTLQAHYTLVGAEARWVGFADGGFIGGALEAAGTYQLTNANLTGLSDAILAESGIGNKLKPQFGVMAGARGLLSLTSWLQINTLVRLNFATQSNLFWAGVGMSLRIF